jgi:predicted transposase/invertase (TIGR01784 family)
METDSFFYQLFKQLPETLFDLLGQPAERAKSYRFDSVELKKSMRIDGLFLPRTKDLPFYVVEVQNQPLAKFYANLFAKAFSYLDENDPAQDWKAVAIFGSRSIEPTQLQPYRELLQSERVTRIYLDEVPVQFDAPFGLGLLQLLRVPENQIKELTGRMFKNANRPGRDRVLEPKVIELAGEALSRRFPKLSREEILDMIQLANIRDTRSWKEAWEEGEAKGLEKGLEKGREEGEMLLRKEMVQRWIVEGKSEKEIAKLMAIPLREVRRLAKNSE